MRLMLSTACKDLLMTLINHLRQEARRHLALAVAHDIHLDKSIEEDYIKLAYPLPPYQLINEYQLFIKKIQLLIEANQGK